MRTGGWNLAPSSLAQWFSGVGTVLAVFIVLFKDLFLVWKRRPILDVTCSKDIPETVRTTITTWPGKYVTGDPRNVECYFVRIKVTNTGSTRAEKVQVSATALTKRGLDNKFVDIQTTLPSNMRWSNSPHDAPLRVLDGISQNMSSFCDIVTLRDPHGYQRRPAGAPDNLTIGLLELEFYPGEEWHLLTPGTYRISLKIGAANAAPIDRTIEFTHTGAWTNDDALMQRDFLDVKLI
jgi:hypothetical protein